jgi:hypothetical protein
MHVPQHEASLGDHILPYLKTKSQIYSTDLQLDQIGVTTDKLIYQINTDLPTRKKKNQTDLTRGHLSLLITTHIEPSIEVYEL